jgi:hypothetical protein
MTPERAAELVARWVRFYTRDLPDDVAQRRVDEIDADLHDHIAHEREHGTDDRRIALSILSRMVRGLGGDASWRDHQVRANLDHPATLEAAMRTHKMAYRSAVGVAIAAALLLYWIIGAVGLIGVDGDRADMMYLGVFAVGILGAAIARLRPDGMALVLLAMALAQALVAVIAVIAGKHQSPVTSLPELLGLNGFFVALFVGSAWLFRQAARYQPPPDEGPNR